MPWGLRRCQQSGDLHFITSSCYRRQPLLATPHARHVFEQTLERVRRWYGFFVTGYVVMPEHVHLLVSEPERSSLAVALQMLKQISARKLLPTLQRSSTGTTQKAARFWQTRYYDFNVDTRKKRIEKLRYIHRNPVRRGLVTRPEDWEWSSFRHHATGEEGAVEIESPWTARQRERMGMPLSAKVVPEPTLSPTAGDKGGAPQPGSGPTLSAHTA